MSADRSDLIAVRPEVVMTTMVEDLHRAALARARRPLPDELEADLARLASEEAARRLARLGHVSRALEVERFLPAREPMPWLADALREAGGADAAPGVAAELAVRERPERPSPKDPEAVSWRVPGPGGHVRHFLALRAAEEVRADGMDAGEAKRVWLSGFLLACCHEVAAR